MQAEAGPWAAGCLGDKVDCDGPRPSGSHTEDAGQEELIGVCGAAMKGVAVLLGGQRVHRCVGEKANVSWAWKLGPRDCSGIWCHNIKCRPDGKARVESQTVEGLECHVQESDPNAQGSRGPVWYLTFLDKLGIGVVGGGRTHRGKHRNGGQAIWGLPTWFLLFELTGQGEWDW